MQAPASLRKETSSIARIYIPPTGLTKYERDEMILLTLFHLERLDPRHVIKVENRFDYYNALDKAHTQKDYGDFIRLIAKESEDALDLYLRSIE